MKDTLKAMVIGVAVGLGGVVVWRVLSNEEVRASLKSGVEQVTQAASEKVSELSEEAILQKARLTGDPSGIQQRAADQWSAATSK